MKKRVAPLIASLSFILLPLTAETYTFNYVNEDKIVSWESAHQTIHVNTSNVQGMSSSVARSIISNSVQQWNLASPRTSIALRDTTGGARQGRNDLYFSSDSIYLGPSVAGVTVTTHEQGSGKLIEANIIINNDIDLKSSASERNFLGDVVTHELGHFFGLGHSQLFNSSMFYRLRKGQHVVHSDDKAGLKALYPYSDSTQGSITGKIVGGTGLGVFGAHVSAISYTTGKMVAASVSNQSGLFTIEGLPIGDQYFLYVDRLKGKENYSSFYAEAKSDFCNSGFAFRGSFFQTCLTEDEGFPQAIEINSASRMRNIGEVTIRCNLDVPIEYIRAKGRSNFEVRPAYFPLAPLSLGEAFVGFFTKHQSQNEIIDRIDLNYTDIDLLEEFGHKDLYLEVNFLIDEFQSPLQLRVEGDRINGENFQAPSPNPLHLLTNQFGNPKTSFKMLLPLSLVDYGENFYTLDVFPRLLEDYAQDLLLSVEDFLPSYDLYGDDLLFYLMKVNIVERVSTGVYQELAPKLYRPVRDNNSCRDGNKTYDVKSPDFFPSAAQSRNSRPSASGSDPLSVGCAMIEIVGRDQGGPGPGGNAAGGLVVLGLVLAVLILIEKKKKELVS